MCMHSSLLALHLIHETLWGCHGMWLCCRQPIAYLQETAIALASAHQRAQQMQQQQRWQPQQTLCGA